MSERPVVLAGCRALLAQFDDLEVIEVSAGEAQAALLDVVLLDLAGRLPTDEAFRQLLATGTPVLAIASGSAAAMLDAAHAGRIVTVGLGASGDEIRTRLIAVASGDPGLRELGAFSSLPNGLTRRELEVLAEIARGRTNAEIAGLLHVSINTIKTNVRSSYHKIGATSRSQAVAWFLREAGC